MASILLEDIFIIVGRSMDILSIVNLSHRHQCCFQIDCIRRKSIRLRLDDLFFLRFLLKNERKRERGDWWQWIGRERRNWRRLMCDCEKKVQTSDILAEWENVDVMRVMIPNVRKWFVLNQDWKCFSIDPPRICRLISWCEFWCHYHFSLRFCSSLQEDQSTHFRNDMVQ